MLNISKIKNLKYYVPKTDIYDYYHQLLNFILIIKNIKILRNIF